MVNPVKNEVAITLGDETLVLRPTFACLVAIEAKTNKSLVELVNAFGKQQGTLIDAVAIYHEATKAAGKAVKEEKLADLAEEVGSIKFCLELANFFAVALYGGKVMEEESKKNQDQNLETV